MARHENPDLDPDKVPLTWIGLTTLQLRLLVAIADGSPDELLQAWHARRPSGTEAPDPVSDISAAVARGAAEEALLSLQALGMAQPSESGPVITPEFTGALDVFVRPAASFDGYEGPVGTRPASATVRFGEWGASSVSESAPGVLTFTCGSDPERVVNAVLLPVFAAVLSSVPRSESGEASPDASLEIPPAKVVEALGPGGSRSLIRCVATVDTEAPKELLWFRGSAAQFLYSPEPEGAASEAGAVSASDEEVLHALRALAQQCAVVTG